MSFFEELKSRGATEEEIREVFLEDNSDAIAGLYDKGATVDEIFDIVQEDGGIPKQMFFQGTTDEVKYLKEEEEANKTTSEKVGDAAQAWFEGKELTGRGALNPVLKVLSAGERWLSSIGVGDEKDDILEALTSNKEAIAKLEERQKSKVKELSMFGIKYEPTITNADIAEFAIEYLPLAMVNKLRQAAMGEGIFQGVMSFGEGNSGNEAREDMLKTFGLVYGGGKTLEYSAKALYPAFSKASRMIKNMGTDDLTQLKKMTGISDEKMRILVEETDDDLLPLVLAEAGGDRTRPLLIQALNDSNNEIVGKYIERITNRAKAAYKSIGGDTSQQTQAIASEAYGDMVRNIKELNVQVDYAGSGFRGKLEELRRVSFDDATDRKISGFLNQLDVEPITDLSTLLKARREINEFARGARNSTQAYKLRELSRDMKSYIDNSDEISDGVKGYINKTNEMYGRSMQQKTILEIFNKNSGKSGTGLSRERAVDWVSLKEDLSKEIEAGTLNSQEATVLLNISKQFDRKIGNLDDVLFGGVRTEAGASQPTGIATTLKGRFDQMVTKNMFNIILERIPGLESTQLKNMQRLISESLSKSSNSIELSRNIIKNKNTPEAMRTQINTSLSKLKEDFVPRTQEEAARIEEVSDIVDNVETTATDADIDHLFNRTTQDGRPITVVNQSDEIPNISETVPPIADNASTGGRNSYVPLSEKQEEARRFFDIDEEEFANMHPSRRDSYVEEMRSSPDYTRQQQNNSELANSIQDDISSTPSRMNVSHNERTGTTTQTPISMEYETGKIPDVGNYDADTSTINTISTADRTALREVVSDILETRDYVDLVNSNGRVNMRITNPKQISDYWSASSRSRNAPDNTSAPSVSLSDAQDIVNRHLSESFPSARINDNTINLNLSGSGSAYWRRNSDGVWYGMTTGFERGSGVGGNAYMKVWDTVEELGDKTRPTSGMYPINRFRMTMNMLKYVTKRGEDAPHVLFQTSGDGQVGVPHSLNGEPLTIENAKKVVGKYVQWINSNVFTGARGISHNTTDARLKELADRYGKATLGSGRRDSGGRTSTTVSRGSSSDTRILSYDNLKMLRDLKRAVATANNSRSTQSQVVAAIATVATISEYLDSSGLVGDSL